MTTQELNILIAEGHTTFSNTVFENDINIAYPSIPSSKPIRFLRCTFNELQITGCNDPNLSISFSHCSFTKLDVSSCELKEFRLSAIENIKQLTIYNLSTEELTINSDNKLLEADFYIDQTTVSNYISCSKLNLPKGTFTLDLIKSKEISPKGLFRNSVLPIVNISVAFGFDSDFSNINIQSGIFDRCTFENISFENSEFIMETLFRQCRFNETCIFDKIKNDITASLKFTGCLFKNTTSFNGTKLYKLTIDNCIFEESAYFQDSFFDIIKFEKSLFEKNAFFDDIKIKQIHKCDRRTIRNIKLHLQKSENKIDYNKFRVYEFEAYKEDLKKGITKYHQDKNHFYHRIREIKHLKRDLFILQLIGFFSDYGTDWKRALKCTILFSTILYIIFFILENYYNDWNPDNWEAFPIGFLRFFILTDFYNPLGEGRTYIQNDGLNHFFSWLIFIFGKIVIAFGIYEMIQAFRKFKA